MQQSKDFLVEIHTEELPPKALLRLAENFLAEIKARLDKLELSYADAKFFATPRRLAVLVEKLAAKQQDSVVERKGPALEAAFDKDGKPTPACVGFAKSCGITPRQLQTIKTAQGTWVGYQQTVVGKTAQELLPTVVQQALAALPIPKRMRWGSGIVEFIRPVLSVLMLYGDDVVDAEILGCKTGRMTRGHRFHSEESIAIANPSAYVSALEKAYVIADFTRRKEMIRAAALKEIPQKDAHVVMDENLLDEVTGLVEWPVGVCGSFAKEFLAVPSEALIAAMQDHQRYFPVMDAQQQLLPYFITMSNIQSNNIQSVIAGNERVLRARLSDAAFFFMTDKKQRLSNRIEQLKTIIFQAKLGTLYDKSQRVAALAAHIAKQIQVDVQLAERAALLAKTDLTTQMVGEFPELQGVMGYYYAKHDGEADELARALNEQYSPRFSGDVLPVSLLGCTLALADRLDTLVGIFGINQIPTGDKDPYGLRRAALGVLRILIEKKLNLDLHELLTFAAQQYHGKLENPTVVTQLLTFILERLKPWYQDQGVTQDVFAAVIALKIANPYDIHLRIQAVQQFKKLPEAESLSIANKRVSNILAKAENVAGNEKINENLFEHEAERALALQLTEKQQAVSGAENYAAALTQLAGLRQPVDDFFEHVMVMAEDKPRRDNRLLMLKQLRELFLHVADIALLQ